MKTILIGGLLSLLALFAYDRISANLYRASEPPAATRAWQSGAPVVALSGDAFAGDARTRTPAQSPLAPVPESTTRRNEALTIAEYVLLHRTRFDGMPLPDRPGDARALK